MLGVTSILGSLPGSLNRIGGASSQTMVPLLFWFALYFTFIIILLETCMRQLGDWYHYNVSVRVFVLHLSILRAVDFAVGVHSLYFRGCPWLLSMGVRGCFQWDAVDECL